MSNLVGKLETEVVINASAEKFYEMFSLTPYLISKASPTYIQAIDLVSGEWGTVGSTIVWNYLQDGNVKAAKVIVTEVEAEKKLGTFKFVEGDLMQAFKELVITLKVTPKPEGQGGIAHWDLAYEKLSEEVPTPEILLQLYVVVSKDVDEHLLSQG